MHDLYSLTFEELLDYTEGVGGAVVILRPIGGIGDAVMILPTITELRVEWGDDVPIIIICIDYIEPIFRHHPDVNCVVSLTGDQINRHEDRIKAEQFRMAGAIVYPLFYPCPAAVYEGKYNPYIKKSRQTIFAEACDVEFKGGGYNVKLSEEELNVSKDLGINDRYVMVHLRSHDKWRDYPELLTKALLIKLVRLGKKYDFEVVSVDSVLDFDIPKVRAIHNTHLNSVMGLLANAMQLIGPDSSMVHVAGSIGTSVLGVFGPTDPAVRLKYENVDWMDNFDRCDRQYCWYHPCKRKFCLKTLKPSRIKNRVSNILLEEGWL